MNGQDFDQITSDQQQGLPRPDLQKPISPDAVLIDLIPPNQFTVGQTSTIDVIRERISHRDFTTEFLTLEELSFLLWATQGVRDKVTEGGITYVMRNVPLWWQPPPDRDLPQHSPRGGDPTRALPLPAHRSPARPGKDRPSSP